MSSTYESPLMVRRDGKWQPLTVQKYKNEDVLQSLIHETPSLLPGVSPEAVAVRELSVPEIGWLDLLVVDSDGTITLVECKLQSNSEIRRKVVGQVLAYAAGLWRLTFEDLNALFVAAGGDSLEHVFGSSEGGADPAALRSAVQHRLSTGTFRLLIAVDQVTDELRLIVEYLNTHIADGIEILLFEVGVVSDGDVEILVPRVFGGESARLKSAAGPDGKKWAVEDVFTAITSLSGAETTAAIRKLHDAVLTHGWLAYPGKGANPTLSTYTKIDGKPRALLTIYAYDSGVYDRAVTFNFGSQRSMRPIEVMESYLADLQAVPELAPYLGTVRERDFDEYTIVPFSAIAAPGVAEAIADAWQRNLA